MTMNQEWRRGWRPVLGAMLGIGTGAALYQFVSSLFVPALEAEFGWTRGDIATAAGIGLLGALSAPLLGALADRVGVRPVIIGCVAAIALTHMGFAMMTGALWQFMLGVAVLGVAAPGCTGVVYSRVIAGWFEARRGLALGLMGSGLPIATLLLAPVIEMVIADHGWRAGYLLLAALAGPLGLPAILLLVRERHRVDPPPESDAPVLPGLTLRAALRTRGYWLLAIAMLGVNAPATGVVTSMSPLVTDKGLTAASAALIVSIFGGSVLVGRIGVGLMLDRMRPDRVAMAVTGASIAGFLILLGETPSFATAALAVTLIGLMQGAETDILAFFAARLFGLTAYSAIYGTLFTVSLLSSAIGIVAFGRIFDATGGYALALWLGSAALAMATLSYALIDRRKRANPAMTV